MVCYGSKVTVEPSIAMLSYTTDRAFLTDTAFPLNCSPSNSHLTRRGEGVVRGGRDEEGRGWLEVGGMRRRERVVRGGRDEEEGEGG